MKYSEWLNEWLESYVRPVVKERTYNKYRFVVGRYLSPDFGGTELEELRESELQRFALTLARGGLASGTVRNIINILSRSLKVAGKAGAMHRRIGSEIIRPKCVEKKVGCFTIRQQKRLEEYILSSGNDRLLGIIFSLYTGLRIGELLALTWSDIDFERRVVTIQKTCFDSWDGGCYHKVIDTPKTLCSLRTIPIPSTLIPWLRRVRRTYKCEYVIRGRTAFGAEVRTYQRTFRILLGKLHLPAMGFHSLRHTFATRALECGMDVKTLAEILGHKNPTITLRRYAHSMMEHKTIMMNKVGKMLGSDD